jgi:O-antigen/teichoic acid export membrane protein
MAEVVNSKSGLFWSAINTWTSNLLSFAIFGILARLVAPDDFGVVAIATIFVALGQIVINDTVGLALIQRSSLEEAHLDSAFWVMAGLGILICGIEVIVAPLSAKIFSEPRLTLVVQVISFRLVLDSLLVVPQGLLLKQLDFKSLAIRSLVASIASGIIGVGMALAGGGVWALVAQQLTNGLFTLVTCWLRIGWRPRLTLSGRHARELWSFSAHTMLWRFFSFLGTNADRAIIGNLMGPGALGFYFVARRTEMIVEQSLAGVVNAVSFPLFASRQNDRVKLASGMITAASLTNMITLPAFAGLASIAPDIVPLVFGPKWTPSTEIVQILAIAGIFAASDGIHEAAIRALGHANWLSVATVTWSLLTIIGFLVAYPYGLAAMATSYVVVNALTFPVYFWMVSKLLPIRLSGYLKTFIAPCAATAAMVIMIVLMRRAQFMGPMPAVIRVAFEIVIGAVAYLTFIFIFSRSRFIQLLKYGLAFKS